MATAYILLYVIAPVLNKGVLYMTRKQIKYTIIGLLVWFCIIKSIVPVIFPTDMFGYNLDWYICLYLIAAYIRKYNVKIPELYNHGYSRNGCMFCGFGAHLEEEPNRFQKLAQTHPAQYNYFIKNFGNIILDCDLKVG